MEFNLLPENFVRLFDSVYLILESRYFSSNRFQLFNVSRSSAKIQLLRVFVISAIIRIKKQKRDSCSVSTSLYRPEPVSLDLSSVQFSRARGKLIKYENYNSPQRISRERACWMSKLDPVSIFKPRTLFIQ